METVKIRRKRRRRPTITPRFGASTVALELGLLRMSLQTPRDMEPKDDKEKDK